MVSHLLLPIRESQKTLDFSTGMTTSDIEEVLFRLHEIILQEESE
jgi:hypothetical protein